MPSYQLLKTVVKTIDVLTTMNRSQISSISQLHQATKLPKPTLVRILETLVSLGFVNKDSNQAGYCLTSKVLSLSAGYHGGPKIIEVAAPICQKLTEACRWPAALATLDVDAMVVRYSTIPETPFAHVQSTLNNRLSLVGRAHGRAYLAFCPPGERKILLNMIKQHPMDEDVDTQSSGVVDQVIEVTRNQGFSLRDSKMDEKTGTVAVPIKSGQRVIATMGFTYFKSAVSHADIVEKLVPHLLGGAKLISEKMKETII